MRMGFCVAVVGVGGCLLLLYTSGGNALFCYVGAASKCSEYEEPLDQRTLASPKFNAFLFLERKERKAKTTFLISYLPHTMLRECRYAVLEAELSKSFDRPPDDFCSASRKSVLQGSGFKNRPVLLNRPLK